MRDRHAGRKRRIPQTERPRSTEDVYQAKYQPQTEVKPHDSPYKFLDYFDPKDADIFFGREQEIRQLQRKFYRARLLILHGESGTGKTSLIRAGLIPRLPSESFIPVYVRALEEPSQAIKEAMIDQLGIDRQHANLPLADFLAAETTHLSKTVVLILDQFASARWKGAFTLAPAYRHIGVSLICYAMGPSANFKGHPRLVCPRCASPLAPDQAPVGPSIWHVHRRILDPKHILPQLDETGQGIEPPLLQIVCDALYQQAKDAGRSSIGEAEYAAWQPEALSQ